MEEIETNAMLLGISLLAEKQAAKYLTIAWRILNASNPDNPLPCELTNESIEIVKYLIEESVPNFKAREEQFPINLSEQMGLKLYSHE